MNNQLDKALFLDRDGVIIQMIYNQEHGTIDTARTPEQVELMFGIEDLLHAAIKKGYKLIVISNQPGIGLGKMSKELFEQVTVKMKELLQQKGIPLQADYYAFHHPFAKLEEYKMLPDTRKPKPDMLLQAAREHNIDVTQSFMIGDGVNDVKAGASAGCKTVLIANILESENLRILERELGNIQPDYLVKKLPEIIAYL